MWPEGWEQKPTQLSIKCTWVCEKAESEREITGRLSHSTRVNNRKQFCFPLLRRNQNPFCLAAFCVQVVSFQLWQSLPPSRWAACDD